MSDDAKTNLLAAALHFNPDLKKEVEDWVRSMVQEGIRFELMSADNFERVHINCFPTFKRLVREATKQDIDTLRNTF
jgi:hypothetical protein